MEEVAIALHECEMTALDNGLAPFERQPDSYKNTMRSRARAAIAAMRVPTEAMIEAGDDICPIAVVSADYWTAMIDAALAESTVQPD